MKSQHDRHGQFRIFKTVLSLSEYKKMEIFFKEMRRANAIKTKISEYFYLDTSDAAPKLYPKRVRLRVRIRGHKVRIGLKIKSKSQEIFQKSSLSEFETIKNTGNLPAGKIKKALTTMSLNFPHFEVVGTTMSHDQKMRFMGGYLRLNRTKSKKDRFELEFDTKEQKQIEAKNIMRILGLNHIRKRRRTTKLSSLFSEIRETVKK